MLIQQEPREIFQKSYWVLQAENGGVVGMLEVIQSDFARLKADTKAAEATSQKEYDTFMEDCKSDREVKLTDIEHKAAKKQDEHQAKKLSQHAATLLRSRRPLLSDLFPYRLRGNAILPYRGVMAQVVDNPAHDL